MIPIRTNRPQRRTPWVNYTLVAVNALVFVATYRQIQAIGAARRDNRLYGEVFEKMEVFRLYLHTQPEYFRWYQLLTHQFLHGGWAHVIFNMVFLYVFGKNLEDRLRHSGYLAFYLAGGVVAGLGQLTAARAGLVGMDPVLGASGAVSAVTGGFLALFPLTYVTVLFLFFIITVFEVQSIYLILFYLCRDLISQIVPGLGGSVAYLAHISGTVYGFVVGMGLLAARVLAREPYDFLTLVTHWNRRRRFRSVTRGGPTPWEGEPSQRVTEQAAQPDPHRERVMDLRGRISEAVEANDPDQAVRTYEQLLELDREQVLPRELQMQIANRAMSTGRYRTAARAYELFLGTYKRDPERPEVELLVGVIYARYLDDRERARERLQAARDKLGNPQRQQMAERMLEGLGS